MQAWYATELRGPALTQGIGNSAPQPARGTIAATANTTALPMVFLTPLSAQTSPALFAPEPAARSSDRLMNKCPSSFYPGSPRREGTAAIFAASMARQECDQKGWRML